MAYRDRNDSNKRICEGCKWYDPKLETQWNCHHITVNPEWCLDPHRETEKGRYYEKI